jgi:hypothetical protein
MIEAFCARTLESSSSTADPVAHTVPEGNFGKAAPHEVLARHGRSAGIDLMFRSTVEPTAQQFQGLRDLGRRRLWCHVTHGREGFGTALFTDLTVQDRKTLLPRTTANPGILRLWLAPMRSKYRDYSGDRRKLKIRRHIRVVRRE